jgi:IS5 family transposase
VLVDTNGIPLALALSPANVHDSRLFASVLDAVPPVRQCAGRPPKRPAKLHADKGYDFDHCRRATRRRASRPASPAGASTAPSAWAGIARRGHEAPVPSGMDRPEADG